MLAQASEVIPKDTEMNIDIESLEANETESTNNFSNLVNLYLEFLD